ncbi:adenylate/guanylate cyclase domain-containing protein [Candidatus Villigracilis saccharophilus]|uniref:adenylate/guanylate cyclase domain-containing protein n=1 Tax=Candidatus Villigracilis saccharophilus TaxID=3140684 RepID=UPI003136A814|nr:adenylate/guanylate cyclase domain-containing protein [Anaerolineales bacterium]
MSEEKYKHFQDLILQFARETTASGRQTLEEHLWEEFGAERVVFVLDMSGFSLLTRKYGIIHYLSMVSRMQLISEPIIKTYGGSLIKYEADNCFAVFPDTLSAIHAAITLQLAFEASNLLTSDDLDVHISCGIDHGRILIVGNEDCFGDAVNRACKLGEDVAAKGEILVTKDAIDTISTDLEFKTSEVNISISGLAISAYSIDYRSRN